MDIFWANAAALSLPSSQRVEVLVHDGGRDLQLWPGPGPDRNLLDAYGPGLREALEAQRTRHGGALPLGEAVRLHPGKLHCNYLLWVATREPERDAQLSDAPSLELLEQSVLHCLEIASNNGSVSVAFGALGEGPKAAPPSSGWPRSCAPRTAITRPRSRAGVPRASSWCACAMRAAA